MSAPVPAQNDQLTRLDLLKAFQAALEALQASGVASSVGFSIAEEPLTSERLAAVLESIQDVIYSVTPDGNQILYVSPSAERVYETKLEDFKGNPRDWFSRIHESDREMVRARLPELFRDGRCDLEYRIELPSGGLRWLRDRMQIVRDASGRAIRIDGIASDITPQVHADMARELAEGTLRLKDRALESTHNGVVVTDMTNPSHPIIYANPGFERITGYSVADVYGLNCGFLQREDREQPGLAELREAIRDGRECQVVLRNYRKDGTLFWNELSISPVRDPDGRVTHYVGVQNDITERIRQEEELQDRTQRLNAIFSLSPDGFVSFDKDGRVAYVNPAFTRMTGLTPPQLIGHPETALDACLQALCDPKVPYPSLQDATCAHPGEENRKTGAFDMLQLAIPERRILSRSVRREDGGSKVLYFRDVTRETEVDRMKSEFLSTAAHELRTPMASVFGFSELLLKRDYDDKTRKDLLSTIHRQAGALIHLLNELLDLARIEARAGKDFKIKVQPLKPIVENTVAALLVPNDPRTVVVDLPETLPHCAVDAEKLQQALTNLLSNAYKYSPNGGEIRLDVITVGHADQVGIRVTDHGIGMTPEQLARCFERFYRADASQNIPGTGLGLALVKEIIEIFGGSVQVESAAGRGTTATVWLKVSEREAVAA
ncbi:MAG: PAS domain S-box protein [Burkholderiales bacterium]